MRCVVVGAGVVDLAAAREFARSGPSVVVLEAGAPGAGASSTSFEWVNANLKLPEPYFRLYVIANRSGITLAPLLGKLARREMVDGDTQALLAAFRPDQFADPAADSASSRLVRTVGEQ